MAKLACNASLLKDNDYRLKKLSFSHKVCTVCDLSVRENVNHIVMQCPVFGVRSEICDILKSIEDCYIQEVLKEPQESFHVIMGKHQVNVPFEYMLKLWLVTSDYITRIHNQAIRQR